MISIIGFLGIIVGILLLFSDSVGLALLVIAAGLLMLLLDTAVTENRRKTK